MSRTVSGGRRAQPKRRASGAAAILPALPLPARAPARDDESGTGRRAGRRRADGAPRVARSGGSHRAPRTATPVERVTVDSDERPVPWARTVAFSGVTGVAALTVGLTVLTDPDTASGFSPGAGPQQTAAVTVIERAQADGPRVPVAQRSAPAEYAAPPAGRTASTPATADAPAPVVAATPTARPSTTPAPAPDAPATPEAPEATTPAPTPEESPSPGLLEGLTGTLDDTVTGVVGVLPNLGG